MFVCSAACQCPRPTHTSCDCVVAIGSTTSACCPSLMRLFSARRAVSAMTRRAEAATRAATRLALRCLAEGVARSSTRCTRCDCPDAELGVRRLGLIRIKMALRLSSSCKYCQGEENEELLDISSSKNPAARWISSRRCVGLVDYHRVLAVDEICTFLAMFFTTSPGFSVASLPASLFHD